MTPMQETVTAAIKLLAVPSDRKEEAVSAVRWAVNAVRHDPESWDRALRSKAEKNALKKWCAAARRLDVATKELITNGSLVRIQMERYGFGDIERLLPALVAMIEPIAEAPSGKVVRSEWRKENAAREALNLLRQFSLPSATTKKSQFCRLAAILSGDPSADLHHQCRAALKASANLGMK